MDQVAQGRAQVDLVAAYCCCTLYLSGLVGSENVTDLMQPVAERQSKLRQNYRDDTKPRIVLCEASRSGRTSTRRVEKVARLTSLIRRRPPSVAIDAEVRTIRRD